MLLLRVHGRAKEQVSHWVAIPALVEAPSVVAVVTVHGNFSKAMVVTVLMRSMLVAQMYLPSALQQTKAPALNKMGCKGMGW